MVSHPITTFKLKTMVYNQQHLTNTGSTTTTTTWLPNGSSGGATYPANSGTTYVGPYNTTGYWTEKKKSLKEYMEKLRASERLILALKLFKEDKITEEQALEMIISDAQFYIE